MERPLLSVNTVTGITEQDYSRTPEYIRVANSIAQVAYESMYVIDYYKKNFLYVSDNPLFLCGLTSKEVMGMGYGFYRSHVPEDEIEMLLEINAAAFGFLNRQPIEDRNLISISCDFHIKNGNGNQILINHKLTPLAMDPSGHLWLAVCCVSLSSHDKPGHIIARKAGNSAYWSYGLSSKRWAKVEKTLLADAEKEVLQLSAQGMTIEDIAIKLNRSKDAIKSRRRAIFEKLGVKSISEAITFALNYKLI